jgi:hypothetical protein
VPISGRFQLGQEADQRNAQRASRAERAIGGVADCALRNPINFGAHETFTQTSAWPKPRTYSVGRVALARSRTRHPPNKNGQGAVLGLPAFPRERGVLAARPAAFVVFALYALAWIVFGNGFEWHSFATLATWAMTLVIQRAEHRDTQASGSSIG